MIKVKAIYAKEKGKPQQFQCENFDDLKQNLQAKFGVDATTIKFMKPPIKDQATFQKNIKENKLQVTFNGSKKKVEKVQEKKEESVAQQKKSNIKKVEKEDQGEKSQGLDEQELSKEEKLLQNPMKKERKPKRDNNQILKLRLNVKYRVTKDHEERKIKERGILYWDDEINDTQDIGTDHMTCALHLFRAISDVKNFCYDYQVKPRHPSGLFIEQTKLIMKQIDGESGEPANPVQWAISFMVHCADLIQQDFPTYDFNYLMEKMIRVINHTQKRSDPNYKPQPKPLKNKEDPNEDKTLTQVRRWFGIYLSQKTKQEKPDKGDEEEFFRPQKKKEAKKQFLQVVLKCDISLDSKAITVQRAIFDMFDNIHNNIDIIRLPKYLFIHLNRMGYPDPEEPDEWLQNYDEDKKKFRPKQIKKHYHKNLKIPEMLDMFPHCSKNQRDKNGQGKINRVNTFYPLRSYSDEDEDGNPITFETFKTQYFQKKRGFQRKYYTDEELLYMFFQRVFLLDESSEQGQLYDDFYFHPEARDKPTGQFRLMGVIFHKGDYYHEPNEDHTMGKHGHTKDECKGKLMTVVYKKNNIWLKFVEDSVYEIKIQEVQDLIFLKKDKSEVKPSQTWTPVKLLYRQVCAPKSFSIV